MWFDNISQMLSLDANLKYIFLTSYLHQFERQCYKIHQSYYVIASMLGIPQSNHGNNTDEGTETKLNINFLIITKRFLI